MHFYCLVIMPKGVMPSEEAVAELMRPGGSELEVEPYPQECWNCAGAGTYETAEGMTVTCADCDGSGTTMSTSNPNSWWDWYVIGGRWSGVLREPDGLVRDTYRDDLENNNCRVADVVLSPEKYPHTILTPDGEMLINEDVNYMPQPGWKDQARAILWKYAEHYCVVVDYHS